MATEAQGLDHRLNLVANLKLFSAGTSLRNCAPLGNMLTTDSNYKNSHPFFKSELGILCRIDHYDCWHELSVGGRRESDLLELSVSATTSTAYCSSVTLSVGLTELIPINQSIYHID